MITLKLPDGSARQVPLGTTSRQVAEGIGKRLAQAAVAAKVNDQVVDLDREIALPADAGGAPGGRGAVPPGRARAVRVRGRGPRGGRSRSSAPAGAPRRPPRR